MTASDVAALDATAQAALVRSGEVTACELVEWAIERIEALNPTLNAVVTPTFASARAAAAAPVAGSFGGVPMLTKDLAVELPGVRFTEGSRFLRDNVSDFESELARRHRAAGLISLGKTNTPEFGMAPACEPVLFGATRNPWDPACSTSGSSGGSAAAVAAGLVPVAHANDLGGSIRYPASACGLFGLKPTRARNSLAPRYGDVVGGMACEHVLTRSVRDSAALLDATAGPVIGDPYCAPAVERPFVDEVGTDPGRLRIACSHLTPEGPPGHPDCLAALDETVDLLVTLGHDVTEVTFDFITAEVGAAISTVINSAAAWIARYWIRHVGRDPGPDEIEPGTRALWEMGERVTAAEYLLAVEDLQEFSRAVGAFLTRYDVWLTPTLSAPPLPIGAATATDAEPFAGLARVAETIRYAGVVANLTGCPAMSVPLAWNEDGLPIGMHFLGAFGDEATLLRLAGQLELARPWADRWPPINAVGATGG
ncbi:MAG: amidase [Actinomycetota bacterium]